MVLESSATPQVALGPARGSATRSAATEVPPGVVARITAWLARQAELALADIDVSLPQYRILHLLGEGIALPSSLAERLYVQRPSITAVADGLVARRLVVRRPDPSDRRRVTHSITPAGRRLLAAADRAIDERLLGVANAPGDPERAQAAIDGLRLWGPALVAWREQRRAGAVPS
ncbi:MAG: MarR family winged helix-turn-helix transcriptional regulator [Acidimicrobiales bacterium]